MGLEVEGKTRGANHLIFPKPSIRCFLERLLFIYQRGTHGVSLFFEMRNTTSKSHSSYHAQGSFQIAEPKFTSFTTCHFMNDVDMDLFIDAVEKTAPVWVMEMKSRGLLKFTMNRVWNKGEVFVL